jgi:hypothetical protein
MTMLQRRLAKSRENKKRRKASLSINGPLRPQSRPKEREDKGFQSFFMASSQSMANIQNQIEIEKDIRFQNLKS